MRGGDGRRSVLRYVLLLGLMGGCFHGPDVSKIECTGPGTCPSDYICDIQPGQPFGRCRQGVANVDGGDKDGMPGDTANLIDAPRTVDGPMSADGGRDRHDTEPSDGGDASNTPDLPSASDVEDAPISDTSPDRGAPPADAAGALPDLPVMPPDGGGACALATECAGPCQTCSLATHSCVPAVGQADPSGHCPGTCDATGACKATAGQACQAAATCASGLACAPDGHCCDRACTGPCESCETGQCKPVSGAPHTGHTSCAGTSSDCAGSCTGASDGQCSWPSQTACGQASCTTVTNAQAQPTGTNYIPQGTCSSGTCVPGTAASCPGGVVCASATACRSACASDVDCLTGTVCSGGACIGKKANGSGCNASSECQLGNCVDGICCESACNSTCMACSKVKNGVGDGYCRAIPPGTDPDSECAVDTSNPCGHDGTCDGAGACRYQSTSISCGSVSCTGQGTYTPLGHCNGAGSCVPGTAGSCPNNMLCASPSSCAASCTGLSTTGCPSGYKCNASGTSCVPATMQCGSSPYCAIANGGGECCVFNPNTSGTSYAEGCISPAGTSCAQTTAQSGQYVDIQCHSKADCPAGQVCCARVSSAVFGWTAKCVAPYPADEFCHAGGLNGAIQLCDPGISPSECMGTTAYDSFGTSCTGAAFANYGAPDLATCQ